MTLSPRLQGWLARYGPAELLSLFATIGAATVARAVGAGEISIALAATWVGNLAYYGLILGSDACRDDRELQAHASRYTLKHFRRNVSALIVEFGIAEGLDCVLIRPFLMYWTPRWLHSLPLGVLTAKFAADVIFYVPTITSYELSKRKLRHLDVTEAGS